MINNDNGKLYVGSATDLQHRFVIHRIALQEGRHGNIYLQRAFKCNPEAFEFFVIEKCQKQDLIQKEQFWMDFYKVADSKMGYNIAPRASSCAGVKRRPEYVDRVRASLRLIKRSDEFKRKISEANKGKKRPPRTEAYRKRMSESKKGIPAPPGTRGKALATMISRGTMNATKKPVIQINSEGVEVGRFESAKAAAIEMGVNNDSVANACRGNRKTCKGFVWKYQVNDTFSQ